MSPSGLVDNDTYASHALEVDPPGNTRNLPPRGVFVVRERVRGSGGAWIAPSSLRHRFENAVNHQLTEVPAQPGRYWAATNEKAELHVHVDGLACQVSASN